MSSLQEKKRLALLALKKKAMENKNENQDVPPLIINQEIFKDKELNTQTGLNPLPQLIDTQESNATKEDNLTKQQNSAMIQHEIVKSDEENKISLEKDNSKNSGAASANNSTIEPNEQNEMNKNSKSAEIANDEAKDDNETTENNLKDVENIVHFVEGQQQNMEQEIFALSLKKQQHSFFESFLQQKQQQQHQNFGNSGKEEIIEKKVPEIISDHKNEAEDFEFSSKISAEEIIRVALFSQENEERMEIEQEKNEGTKIEKENEKIEKTTRITKIQVILEFSEESNRIVVKFLFQQATKRESSKMEIEEEEITEKKHQHPQKAEKNEQKHEDQCSDMDIGDDIDSISGTIEKHVKETVKKDQEEKKNPQYKPNLNRFEQRQLLKLRAKQKNKNFNRNNENLSQTAITSSFQPPNYQISRPMAKILEKSLEIEKEIPKNTILNDDNGYLDDKNEENSSILNPFIAKASNFNQQESLNKQQPPEKQISTLDEQQKEKMIHSQQNQAILGSPPSNQNQDQNHALLGPAPPQKNESKTATSQAPPIPSVLGTIQNPFGFLPYQQILYHPITVPMTMSIIGPSQKQQTTEEMLMPPGTDTENLLPGPPPPQLSEFPVQRMTNQQNINKRKHADAFSGGETEGSDDEQEKPTKKRSKTATSYSTSIFDDFDDFGMNDEIFISKIQEEQVQQRTIAGEKIQNLKNELIEQKKIVEEASKAVKILFFELATNQQKIAEKCMLLRKLEEEKKILEERLEMIVRVLKNQNEIDTKLKSESEKLKEDLANRQSTLAKAERQLHKLKMKLFEQKVKGGFQIFAPISDFNEKNDKNMREQDKDHHREREIETQQNQPQQIPLPPSKSVSFNPAFFQQTHEKNMKDKRQREQEREKRDRRQRQREQEKRDQKTVIKKQQHMEIREQHHLQLNTQLEMEKKAMEEAKKQQKLLVAKQLQIQKEEEEQTEKMKQFEEEKGNMFEEEEEMQCRDSIEAAAAIVEDKRKLKKQIEMERIAREKEIEELRKKIFEGENKMQQNLSSHTNSEDLFEKTGEDFIGVDIEQQENEKTGQETEEIQLAAKKQEGGAKELKFKEDPEDNSNILTQNIANQPLFMLHRYGGILQYSTAPNSSIFGAFSQKSKIFGTKIDELISNKQNNENIPTKSSDSTQINENEILQFCDDANPLNFFSNIHKLNPQDGVKLSHFKSNTYPSMNFPDFGKKVEKIEPNTLNKLNPMNPLCRMDLDGKCDNPDCLFQHERDFSKIGSKKTDDEILEEIVDLFFKFHKNLFLNDKNEKENQEKPVEKQTKMVNLKRILEKKQMSQKLKKRLYNLNSENPENQNLVLVVTEFLEENGSKIQPASEIIQRIYSLLSHDKNTEICMQLQNELKKVFNFPETEESSINFDQDVQSHRITACLMQDTKSFWKIVKKEAQNQGRIPSCEEDYGSYEEDISPNSRFFIKDSAISSSKESDFQNEADLNLNSFAEQVKRNPNDPQTWIKYALNSIIEEVLVSEQKFKSKIKKPLKTTNKKISMPEEEKTKIIEKAISSALHILSIGIEKNSTSEELWIVYFTLYKSKFNSGGTTSELRSVLKMCCDNFFPQSLILRIEQTNSEPVSVKRKIEMLDKAKTSFFHKKFENQDLKAKNFFKESAVCLLEMTRLLFSIGQTTKAVELFENEFQSVFLTKIVEKNHKIDEETNDLGKIVQFMWTLRIIMFATEKFPFSPQEEGTSFLKYFENVEFGINFELFSNDFKSKKDIVEKLFHQAMDFFENQLPDQNIQAMELNYVYFLMNVESPTRALAECESLVNKHENSLSFYVALLNIASIFGLKDIFFSNFAKLAEKATNFAKKQEICNILFNFCLKNNLKGLILQKNEMFDEEKNLFDDTIEQEKEMEDVSTKKQRIASEEFLKSFPIKRTENLAKNLISWLYASIFSDGEVDEVQMTNKLRNFFNSNIFGEKEIKKIEISVENIEKTNVDSKKLEIVENNEHNNPDVLEIIDESPYSEQYSMENDDNIQISEMMSQNFLENKQNSNEMDIKDEEIEDKSFNAQDENLLMNYLLFEILADETGNNGFSAFLKVISKSSNFSKKFQNLLLFEFVQFLRNFKNSLEIKNCRIDEALQETRNTSDIKTKTEDNFEKYEQYLKSFDSDSKKYFSFVESILQKLNNNVGNFQQNFSGFENIFTEDKEKETSIKFLLKSILGPKFFEDSGVMLTDECSSFFSKCLVTSILKQVFFEDLKDELIHFSQKHMETFFREQFSIICEKFPRNLEIVLEFVRFSLTSL